MASSVREAIVQDLVSALGAISRSNGYNTDLSGRVLREAVAPQRQAFPAVYVAGISETKEIGPLASPPGWKRAELRVTLLCAVAQDGSNPLTDLDLLLADVERAVETDPTRGGRALLTRVVAVRAGHTREELPAVIGEVDVSITYDHELGDPTQGRTT